ncbi:hypothetical protein NX722_13570 [Endozoicomonas gorgoniicola]|uniref:Uncharacterized protein n=1 Tax=Endozoicomonas gorgoniicola TaxID=1234144 RepID=A0ABT3MW87_9GAMM|nr:hypothetical protein [Endozoicomonas gorgoniicola]MCW7553637.1 hypothetical protein [Endozoicomonas gorgoniicola]
MPVEEAMISIRSTDLQRLKEAEQLVNKRLWAEQSGDRVKRMAALAECRVELAAYRKRYFEQYRNRPSGAGSVR